MDCKSCDVGYFGCVFSSGVYGGAKGRQRVLSRNVSYRSLEMEEGSLAALALIKSPCQEMMI